MWTRRLQAPAGAAKTPGEKKICFWFLTHTCEWQHEGRFNIAENNLSEQAKQTVQTFWEGFFMQGPLGVHTVLEIWPDGLNKNLEAPNMA